MFTASAASTSLNVVFIPGSIGAEIRGVDIAGLSSAAVFAEIYSVWLDRQVLLFRGQNVNDSALIEFSRRFGHLDLAPVAGDGSPLVEGHPELFVISNVKEDGLPIGSLGDGECVWHTDMAYSEVPPKASCLYSLEVPDGAGDTGFLNMYAVYDGLSADLRERIRGRTIKHDTKYMIDGYPRNHTEEPLRIAKARGDFDVSTLPGISHPIVRTHPETGRWALYLGRRQNTYINGMRVAESEALLDALWAHVEHHARAAWHHRWRKGDLVIWDNRCVMHRRDAFPSNSRRIMHRTQIRAEVRPT